MSPSAAPTSLLDFARIFKDEAACVEYLEGLRWPEGFVCPECNEAREPFRFKARPRVLRCRACKRDISLTAGSVMHRSKQPLQIWFWAAYMITSHTPGMSALQFQRQMGLKFYEPVWNLLHKLRAGLVRPGRDRIGGQWPVEVDETQATEIRGAKIGQKRGAMIIGAVEVRPSIGRGMKDRGIYAGRLRLRILPAGPTQTKLEGFVTDAVEPGTEVRTDGARGYDDLPGLGYEHNRVVLDADPEKAAKHLPVIHMIFSNMKAWLDGTFHGVRRKHTQAYLNEYVFRFNRRWYPMSAFHLALNVAVSVPGPEYDELYEGTWRHPNPRFAGIQGMQTDFADLDDASAAAWGEG